MRSGGGSFGSLGVHVGQDGWTHLSTYEDFPPILDVDAGSTSVTITVAGREVSQDTVEFGRELAANTARFAAELERLYAVQHPGDDGAPASGEAA
jgi:hypothetical protein